MPQPLTAAELEKHPEFPYVVWDLKASEKALCSVASGRGGPFNISYEIHGHGPKRLMFIMGLGGLKSSWQRQTYDFGHKRADEYSVLIVDNRGIGESDKPLLRYSTSEMARDMIELLEHVGWAGDRVSGGGVNIVGISMGGMIALELALIKPELVSTLILTSTAARLVNTLPWLEHLRNRINMFIPKSIDEQIAHSRAMIYTPEYLASPDDLEYTVQPFPTSGDRFGAAELKKRSDANSFTRTGFMCQAIAAGWHWKSAEQLEGIAESVGRERICVMHGTADRMVPFVCGETLVDELNRGAKQGDRKVRQEFFQGQGHIIPIEKRKEFFDIVADVIEAGDKANSTG